MDDELVAQGRYARLVTTGRRSGLPRTVTVGFIERPDGAIDVAARPGAHWAENLFDTPTCTVTIHARTWNAIAEPLEGVEFARAIRDQILRYGTPAEDLGLGAAFRLRPAG